MTERQMPIIKAQMEIDGRLIADGRKSGTKMEKRAD
jgi:hypothetical protein